MLRTLLTVGLLAAIAPAALAQAKLTGFETRKTDTGLEIVVTGERLPAPKVLRVKGGSSYILEFGATLVGPRTRRPADVPGVQFVEVLQFKARPLLSRVHVSLDAGIVPTLSREGSTWKIFLPTRTTPRAASLPASDPDTAAMRQAERAVLEPTPKAPGDRIALAPKPTATVSPALIDPSDREAMREAEKAVLEPTPKAPIGTLFPGAQEPRLGTRAVAPSPTDPAVHFAATVKATPTVAPAPSPVLTPEERQMRQRVSLNFMQTDVVQILRGLSQQVGVNIITSPEVSPADKPIRLTMSLNDVTIEEALAMITATTGLRYGRTGNTFVVAPNGSFPMVMRQIMERAGESYETRVVNLVSGEAAQIREATLKAMPPDGRGGYYDIIVQVLAASTATSQPSAPVRPPLDPSMLGGGANPLAGAAPEQAAPEADSGPAGSGRARAYYVMLVGDAQRLTQVEAYVRDLDSKIARSFSLSRAETTGTVVVPIQSGQTERIKTMINRLLEENPRKADYSITETNVRDLQQGELSTRVLLMIGPGEELETLRRFAEELDRDLCAAGGIAYASDAAGRERFYEVVELKFIEPTLAEFDLKGRVRGLWVTVLPDPVTPGIAGEAEEKKDALPQDPAGGQGAAGAGSGKRQETELKRAIGREPMRLVLRGTRQQIDEARAYLALVDVAPRQVALELRVMELTREDALRVGIDWSVLTGGRANFIRFNQGLGDSSATPGTFGGNLNFGVKTDPVSNALFYEGASVLGTLDQLANNRNLIARPNALVSDGRTTDLFVGDTVRYIKSIQTSQNGTTVLTDEIKVGVRFGIRARAGGDGNIALDLAQNFSILTGFTPVPGGGSLPQTSDRETTMFVNMQTGETIALGGLILDQDRKNFSGIPLLKDLPIIGRLFGRTNNTRTRTEIVFFLTAVTVDPANRPEAASPASSLERSPRPLEDYRKGREESEKRGMEQRKENGG